MADPLTSILLLLFALAPSLLWLVFYLRKDSHPEPNRMILKIFLAGMLSTIPAIYIETFLEGFFSSFQFPEIIFLFIYFFIGVSLVEELLKYLVVRFGAFGTSSLDEPIDIVLYMIISALGFAAFENVLLLFKLTTLYPPSEIFFINIVRFMQAILLHALVSGLFGYAIALSFLQKKRRKLLFSTGLFIAVSLHGLFNLYIFTIGEQNLTLLFLPVIPLLFLSVVLSFAFRHLKKVKAACAT
jgi:protease PrsW